MSLIAKRKAKSRKLADAVHKLVGARIREKREAAKLKQPELAKAIGVSTGQISRYESGETPTGNATLLQIAKTLGCTASYLLEGTAEK